MNDFELVGVKKGERFSALYWGGVGALLMLALFFTVQRWTEFRQVQVTPCVVHEGGVVRETPLRQAQGTESDVVEPEVVERPTPRPVSHWYTVSAGVNLRQQPSIDAAVLLVLQPEQPIILLDGVEGEWRQVSGGGKTGWIKFEFIEKRVWE